MHKSLAVILMLFITEPATAQEVTFALAWPDSLVATVRAEGFNIQGRPDGSVDTTEAWKGSYRFTARSEGRRIHVSRSDVVIETSDHPMANHPNPGVARGAKIVALTEGTRATMEFMIATYTVDVESGSITIRDIDEHMANLDAVIRPRYEPFPQLQPWNQFLPADFLPDFYQNRARREWNAIVGYWDDRAYSLGQPSRSTEFEVVPVGKGMFEEEMTVTIDVTVVEEPSCLREASGVKLCVRARRSIQPDSDEYVDAMRRLLGMAGVSVDVRSIEVHRAVELVTETTTLVPHYVLFFEHHEGDYKVMDMAVPSPRKIIERYTFDYE